MKPSRKGNVVAVLLVAAANLAMPLQSLNAAAILQKADASAVDDELIIFGRGVPLLTSHSVGAGGRNMVSFQTDACGTLQRLRDSNPLSFKPGAFDEDMDDSYDPLDEAKMLIGRWLAAHAEIAVVADGVERSCDSDSVDLDDPSPELAMLDRSHVRNGWSQLPSRPSIT